MAAVLGGAALRLWGLRQGLPFTGGRPDEREVVVLTAGFPAGDWNPRWFVYPNFYFYLIWGWDELVLAGRALWRETPAYSTMLTTALASLILYGRLLSALAGTATIALLFAIGRRVGGTRLAGLAAILLAGNYLHIRDSHALKPETLLAAGFLLSIWLLARYVAAPGAGRAALAGLAIGLTTAVKYNGILLLVPVYLAGVLASSDRGVRRLLPSGHVALCTAVALAVFLALCPYLLLDFGRTLATFRVATLAVYAARPGTVPAAGSIASRLHALLAGRAFGYHLTVSLRRGSGLLMTLALPFALLTAFRAPRDPMLVLAAAFSLFYLLVIGASPVHLARYLTPLVPLIVLLVARWLVLVAERVRAPSGRAVTVVALAAALLVEPVLRAIAYDRLVGHTDSRVLATRWLAEHLPRGAVVAILGSLYFPIADPELPPGVTRAPLALGETDLDRYGVTHVVTHWHQQLTAFSQPPVGQLTALLPRLQPLAEFSPFTSLPAGEFEQEDAYYVPFFDFAGVVRPGPVVRIYRYAPP